MATVHLFASIGRFRSDDELHGYIDETYDEDGGALASAFMREVGLGDYDPGCIEAIRSKLGRPIPLAELLVGASHSDQWLPGVDRSRLADAAICVFPPNRVEHPTDGTLDYIGAFEHQP